MKSAVSLLYHDVLAESEGPDASGFSGAGAAVYKMKVNHFQTHLEAVAAASGGRPPSVADDLSRRRNGGAPYFLTFDDGGVSAYTLIAGMLESFGWRGNFFITTDRIGSVGFVTADQIVAIRSRGHAIGTHSSSHPERMSRCTYGEIASEWEKSTRRLGEILGEQIVSGSVPGGYYGKKVAAAAAGAGIEILFTSEPFVACRRVESCCVAGRYTIKSGFPPETAGAIVAGKIAPRCRQWLVWNIKKIAKRSGGSIYPYFRKVLLEQKMKTSLILS
ncbi:MAG: polysaccharide deacetylase family protein [Syntrophales bacterium]|nr:polysaccharide deacetylase family protein [Syntrophales bacterium]MDD5531167.1 polysaccharide deacetylase family protein [Syntrophales bacterium]